MANFDDMFKHNDTDAAIVAKGAARCIETIRANATVALVTETSTVRALHGLFETRRGTLIEAAIGRHSVAIFVYMNNAEDRRREQFDDRQSHRTVAADIVRFSGPSLAALTPPQTPKEKHDATFAEFAERCAISFIVGCHEPGQGVIDIKSVRPFAYRLNREFAGFVRQLAQFPDDGPLRPTVDTKQFYLPIKLSGKIISL